MLCKAMHSYMQHEEYTEVNRTILAFKLTEEDKVKKKKRDRIFTHICDSVQCEACLLESL